MARLFADLNIRVQLVQELRRLGHVVIVPGDNAPVLDRVPDHQVLATATDFAAVMLTYDRWDFVALHRAGLPHTGIIVCSTDMDDESLARRIGAALEAHQPLDGKLVRISKPPGRARVE